MNPQNKLLVGAVSAALISAVTLWEGEPKTPYEDIVGVLTVCKGHTGNDIVKGKTYTQQECDVLFAKDIKKYQDGVLACTNVPLTSYQYDALVLFAYNVGVNAYCTSNTIAKPLNSGNYKIAADGLLKWSCVTTSFGKGDKDGICKSRYDNSKFVQGLYNRRAYERKMFLGELNAK